MTEVNKVLIEQTLFGFNDEPLHGEDYLIEAINQYLNNPCPNYTLTSTLNESIQFSGEFSKYVPLLEAADELQTAETKTKELADTENPEKKQTLMQKAIEAAKKALAWWYKVDPDTKAKTCRIIANVVFKVAIIILRSYAKWKITGREPFSELIAIMSKLSDGKKAPEDGEDGDKKSNKLKLKIDVTAFLKRFLTKQNLIFLGVSSLIVLLQKGLETLDHELYYKVNLEGLEENIKKYDKLVDEFNDMLDETEDEALRANLKKGRTAAENALKELILIKEEKRVRDLEQRKKEQEKTNDENKKLAPANG